MGHQLVQRVWRELETASGKRITHTSVIAKEIGKYARRHHDVHCVEDGICVHLLHFVLDHKSKSQYVPTKIVWNRIPLQVNFLEVKGTVKPEGEMVKGSLDIKVQIFRVHGHPCFAFVDVYGLALPIYGSIQQLDLIEE
jgi:hypothetical protein